MALLAISTAACPAKRDPGRVGPAPDAGVDDAAAPVVSAPDAGVPGSVGAVVVPDTPAGRQLSWVLEVINERGGAVTAEELELHFHDSFLAVVPPEQLQTVFAELSAGVAPLTVTALGPEATTHSLSALAASTQGPLAIQLELDATSEQMVGLVFSPVPDLEANRPTSWDAVDANVAALAPRSNYLVAALGAEGCEPLHGLGADQRLAIGSTFKLYVLAEAARQIGAGLLAWDTEVSVRDELKSLPSGQLQNAPAGTLVTIRELADAMISISDNTATDHLIDRLGREQVEAAFAAAGHGAPELNAPLLTTRELFLFKLDVPSAETDDYVARDVAGRREFLGELSARAPTLSNVVMWTAPIRIDELEWFASADDLCAAMAYLTELAEQPGLEPVLDVLALNRGLPISESAFSYAGFKGGSEPGVLNMTWLVRTAAGQLRFVSLGLNDPAAPIDELGSFTTALGIFDLLAAEQ